MSNLRNISLTKIIAISKGGVFDEILVYLPDYLQIRNYQRYGRGKQGSS
jgi:hypothetical protein